MKCYKVSVTVDSLQGEEMVEKIIVRYAGTNALARETRQELVSTFNVKKKDVEIEDAEIPTGKAELLEFVNGLLTQQDPEVSE